MATVSYLCPQLSVNVDSGNGKYTGEGGGKRREKEGGGRRKEEAVPDTTEGEEGVGP